MLLNTFDEWSPLKEVIVGTAANYTFHERESSFDLFYYDQIAHTRMYYPRHHLPSTSQNSSGASQRPSPYDVGFEMMFDGAQCLRLGCDLLINISTINHAMACDWLERHLAGRFRIHRVQLVDSHIDSTVLAMRSGLLLVRSPSFVELLPEPMRAWDVIFPPEPKDNNFPDYDNEDLILTSRNREARTMLVRKMTLSTSATPARASMSSVSHRLRGQAESGETGAP